MGADKAPFKCGACEHFNGADRCELVAGTIEAEGCCNLFAPRSASSGNDAMKKMYSRFHTSRR